MTLSFPRCAGIDFCPFLLISEWLSARELGRQGNCLLAGRLVIMLLDAWVREKSGMLVEVTWWAWINEHALLSDVTCLYVMSRLRQRDFGSHLFLLLDIRYGMSTFLYFDYGAWCRRSSKRLRTGSLSSRIKHRTTGKSHWPSGRAWLASQFVYIYIMVA